MSGSPSRSRRRPSGVASGRLVVVVLPAPRRALLVVDEPPGAVPNILRTLALRPPSRRHAAEVPIEGAVRGEALTACCAPRIARMLREIEHLVSRWRRKASRQPVTALGRRDAARLIAPAHCSGDATCPL